MDVEGTPAGTTLTINAGGGNDTINLSPTGLLLDAIEGAVVVNGEGGTADALNLADQNNAFPDAWDITATSATRPSFGGVTYAGVESLRLDAGLFGFGSAHARRVLGRSRGNSRRSRASGRRCRPPG